MIGLALVSLGCTDYFIERAEDVEGGDSGWTSDAHPIARCAVAPNPVAPPFETATFDGRTSYDPNDLAIEKYEWELVSQPQGSAVSLPEGEGWLEGFMPDLAGDYVVELIVTNENALRSLPCSVTLAAEPSQDLWIEMYWQEVGDDLDLHLLRPGGTVLSEDDCYYFNCKEGLLDWGVLGALNDNPQLDLDDIDGNGPENINLTDPETGVYTVVVHDYSSSTVKADNAATVNVYIDGLLKWSATKVFQGEDQYQDYCTIDWATGMVTAVE